MPNEKPLFQTSVEAYERWPQFSVLQLRIVSGSTELPQYVVYRRSLLNIDTTVYYAEFSRKAGAVQAFNYRAWAETFGELMQRLRVMDGFIDFKTGTQERLWFYK